MLIKENQKNTIQAYYGFEKKPFVSCWYDEPYKAFFKTATLEKKLNIINHFINGAEQLCVILGEDGLGKTILAKYLLADIKMNKPAVKPLLLNLAPVQRTRDWLIKQLAAQLGIDAEKTSSEGFLDFLDELVENKMKVVMIIDNIKLLKNTRIMEEWRGLTNIQPDCMNVFSTVFITTPEEFGELQAKQEFANRISSRIKLERFSEEETMAYINYQLKAAGIDKRLFSDEACSLIYQASHGIPLRVNLLCLQALQAGFEEGVSVINKNVIKTTLAFIAQENNDDTIFAELGVNYLEGYIKPGSETLEVLLNAELLKKVLLTASSDERLKTRLGELIGKAMILCRLTRDESIIVHLKKAGQELIAGNIRETLNSLKAAINKNTRLVAV